MRLYDEFSRSTDIWCRLQMSMINVLMEELSKPFLAWLGVRQLIKYMPWRYLLA